MPDPRFARLKTDPRFRRPRKKQQKIVIDERFKSVFQQPKDKKRKEKTSSQVDKYGRDLSETHEKDNLKNYYQLARSSDEEEENVIDYARGGVLMQSSDEEEDDRNNSDVGVFGDSDSDADEIIKIGGNDGPEIDLDEDTYAELDAQVAAYAEANKDLEEKEDVGVVNRTRRLAVVNLDWDHVRASHLYKIFSSLVSPTAPHIPVSVSSATGKSGELRKGKGGAASLARGSILSVRVYPSNFGRERMEREEKEGPPEEIFRKKRKEIEEINEKTVYEVGDENEYDEDALRRYQLERLRYYYAIVECDTVEAASHVYNELEGTELERSANVFDLSFVPDNMTFDVDPRDEAIEDVSTDYKPIDYVTDALRHSKVKLTWDGDDPERYQVTRRQLTRQEIEEVDFRAYIASSSSEDEGGEDAKGISEINRENSRQKLRALLLDGNGDTLPEGWNNDVEESDVDMKITFTPGLSRQKNEENETTIEKYQRKTREKRKKRKQEQNEKVQTKEGTRRTAEDKSDEFFNFGDDGEDKSEEEIERKTSDVKRVWKEKGSRVHPRTPPPRKESTTDELVLLTASDNLDGQEPKHFNMKAVLKAEKRRGKMGRKGKRDQEEGELQEDFKVNVNDERFNVLHEDHQFAIDPTNPHFQKTKGMKAFLEERQRRQKNTRGEDVTTSPSLWVKDKGDAGLQTLVESVKRKSQTGHGGGKRQRR